MKKKLLALLTLVMTTPVFGAVTVSGTVKTSLGATVPSAKLTWTLVNCISSPTVGGSSVPVSVTMNANSSGVVSGSIAGTDEISCGDPEGYKPYYIVRATNTSNQQIWTRYYAVPGPTFDVGTAPQLNPIPPAPPQPSQNNGGGGTDGTISQGTDGSVAAYSGDGTTVGPSNIKVDGNDLKVPGEVRTNSITPPTGILTVNGLIKANTGPRNICSGLTTGISNLSTANTAGLTMFPADNPWNQRVDDLPVDPNSDKIIAYINAGSNNGVYDTSGTDHAFLHPGFGSTSGIPLAIAASSETGFTEMAPNPDTLENGFIESDETAFPLESYFPIESLPDNCSTNPNGDDQHLIVVDKDSCFLYEVYQAQECDSKWRATGTAVWDMINYEKRPLTWSSVDAGGLPVLAGLIRFDEMSTGHINHAIRFTLRRTHRSYVDPATHWAGNDRGTFSGQSDPSPIPMGMRMRLKKSYDIYGSQYGGFNTDVTLILKAMQDYGIILADNGSNMFLTGTVDGRWNDSSLHDLTKVGASNFEVVQMPGAYFSGYYPGNQVTLSGLTTATWLNGKTITIDTPMTFNQVTGHLIHADYSQTTDTGTVTMTAINGTVNGEAYSIPLAEPSASPISSVQVVGNEVTIFLQGDTDKNVPAGIMPVINSLTASQTTVAAGTPVTLTWDVTDSTYNFFSVDPVGQAQMGAVRGDSIIVTPTETTTYTLKATNTGGRATASVTITVQ